MTSADDFTIREADAADLATLIDLEAEAFGAARWGAEGVRTALVADGNQVLLAETKMAVPVGFAFWRAAADEAEILTIGVASAFRRQGMASFLLTRLIGDASLDGVEALFLEVDGCNDAAITLYEKAGFEVVGARKRYYRNGADALIMRRPLISPP